MWKDFLYFTRSERRGILILIILILFVCALPYLLPHEDMSSKETDDNFLAEKEYAEFMASIEEIKSEESHRIHKNHFVQRNIILKSFDPNTADSTTFLDLGLPSWMAGNILRYRSKGGHFRKPEDFRKIYGLTDEQYSTLLPYIAIESNDILKDTIRLFTRQTNSRDSLLYYKYPVGTIIDLNRADTVELKKIPGIGGGIAHMIVNYRKRLGGFYSIGQLNDIHLSAEKLQSWFTIDRNAINKLNLNRVGIEKLKAHPYINFYQAKVIVEYRKKKGALKNLQQLKLYEEFSEKDFERIQPYICFD